MIKFILSIFLIIDYLKFYSAQQNYGYIRKSKDVTTIEYIESPIIDIVVKSQPTDQRSNIQHTTKLNGLTNKNGQISNQQIWSNQNKNFTDINQKYRTVQKQNTGNFTTVQYPNTQKLQNQYQNSHIGQYQNTGNTGRQFQNGQRSYTQNENSGINQNQNTGITTVQYPKGQTLHNQYQNSQIGQYQNTGNTGRQFPNVQKPYTQNENYQNSGIHQNQNTGLTAVQYPNRQTLQSQYQNSQMGQYQKTGNTGRQFPNGEKRYTQNGNSQNSGINQNQNTGIIAGQYPNRQTVQNQNKNSQAGQYQKTGNTGRQFPNGEKRYTQNENCQNSRIYPNQNNGITAGQYPNRQTLQNQYQNSQIGHYQNTGNAGRQFPNVQERYTQNKNFQHSRIYQNQNTGIIAGQYPNRQTLQNQYQNPQTGQYQKTGNTGIQFPNEQRQNTQHQNSGKNQNLNTGTTAGQYHNRQTVQNQYKNLQTDQYQKTGNNGRQFPNGQRQYTQLQNSQNSGIHQNPNTGINSGQLNSFQPYNYQKFPNSNSQQNQNFRVSQIQNTKSGHNTGQILNSKTVQNQNQNSRSGPNQNTIATAGEITISQAWNYQKIISQNQNTVIATGRISNGQTKQHFNQNSGTGQNDNTKNKINDNIEPCAILGKQSTSTQYPSNNHEYPNPYYPQQNQWSINGSQHTTPNQNTFSQGNNIVVTNNPYCTQIAKELIEKGGNVREVFIATSLCEGLVHPMDSGLGGGFQAVYYNFENNPPNTLFIDSREKSPSSTKFTKSSTKMGGNSIAIPSVLAGYESIYNIDKHNNRLQWSQIIQPVLTLCQNGFFMSSGTKGMIKLIIGSYNSTEVHENKLKIPKFCDTLAQISRDGPSSSMYRANGHLHRLLVQDLRSVKSAITSKDIQNYRVQIRQPAITSFEKYRLYSTKSPGSGQAMLFALKIIERLRKVIPSTATVNEKIVYLLKILKYAYTLKPHLREITEFEINKIINEASQSLAEGIVKAGFEFKSTIPTKFGDVTLPKLQTSPSEGTTNIVIKIGKRAITASSSIGSLFGSGIFSENMGFFYNNHLRDFSNPNWRREGKPLKNVAGPNKVTSSTIAPVIMVDNETGEPVFQIGAAGGSHILSAMINTCFNYFILNRSLKDSVSACRIMPKLVYSQNEVTFSYECINNEHSFFNTDTANRLRRIGVGFKYSKAAGHAAVTTLSKLRPGDPEAVFDKRRGGLSFIK